MKESLLTILYGQTNLFSAITDSKTNLTLICLNIYIYCGRKENEELVDGNERIERL